MAFVFTKPKPFAMGTIVKLEEDVPVLGGLFEQGTVMRVINRSQYGYDLEEVEIGVGGLRNRLLKTKAKMSKLPS